MNNLNDVKSSLLPNEFKKFNLTISRIKELIHIYAPIRYLHSKTHIYPCSYRYLYKHFNPVYDESIKRYRLVANFKLDSATEWLNWFSGEPAGTAPTYVYLRMNRPDEFILDFHTLFAYNKGKKFIVDIGNHVMDNSRFWITFDINCLPIKVGYGFHGNSEEIDWQTAGKYPYERIENKQIIYTGLDSNETYLTQGNIKYKKIDILFGLGYDLVDQTNRGILINTSDNYIMISPTNYYGLSNVAHTRTGVYELSAYDLTNWTSQVAFMGHEKIRLEIFGFKIDMLSGLNKLPVYQFYLNDRINKIKYTFK